MGRVIGNATKQRTPRLIRFPLTPCQGRGTVIDSDNRYHYHGGVQAMMIWRGLQSETLTMLLRLWARHEGEKIPAPTSATLGNDGRIVPFPVAPPPRG